MRSSAVTGFLLLTLAAVSQSCGPGRGVGRGRGPRKLTPLVFKQHVPNLPENSITASGANEGPIDRNNTRFQDLVPNYNEDIIIKDEEGTGADRFMTQRCNEKLNTLAISVMNQWPGVRLVVTEGWDEEGHHSPNSLHYEGRAVDVTTSDRDRSKYGMLARLAVEAGFDWVYYESRSHIHCSVKSESSSGKYGGCFPGDTTVQTSTGVRRNLSDLQIGEKILAKDPSTGDLVYSEVLMFLDYDPQDEREFQHVTLRSGRTLTLTGTHLVPVVTANNSRTVYAAALKVGDSLLVSDGANGLVTDEIVELEAIRRTGVYAPLTVAGNLVVNDVVASCYASIDSQSIAHWAFLPLRFVNNIQDGISAVWRAISNPLRSHDTAVSYSKPSVGVHWYARMLYGAASIMVPSHLH
ncbi:indian hedgehog B protein [Aethina tumida]|uniref:indian hedgehog B protein n=1 Tax=Aethina tumida TaxID=116153 RepID=UPI00096AE5A0|nr:indian hedgehog B protein [Aethina tumida]